MVKMNKKGLVISMVAVLTLSLSGCKSETNAIKTKEFRISSEEVYNDVLKSDPSALLEASLKASDVKMLDKQYGSGSIDESKLLSQKKLTAGSLYLETIGQESGLNVTNDDEAKKALRYMEQQKMVLKDVAKDLITDDEAKQYLNLKAQFSVKHVLVQTEEEAKKMKTLLEKGEESVDILVSNSEKAKKAGQKETVSATGITIIEAADYPNIQKGKFVGEFENAALTTSPLNAWSEPVKTKYGFHIQYVYGRENGYKDGDNLEQVKKDMALELSVKNKNDSSLLKMAMIKMREKQNFKFEDEALKNLYESNKEKTIKTFDEEKTTLVSGKNQTESQNDSAAI